MKSLTSILAGKPKNANPVALTAVALLYEVVIGLLDFTTPEAMSFTIFYLLGVAFVAWAAGARAAVLVSAVSAAIMAVHEPLLTQKAPLPWGIFLWNTSTRLLLFCAAGWLAAEITRLNRHLKDLVLSRTTQLQAETEKHKSTSTQLGEALARLRTIIAGAPIVIFAVDRDGIIRFEDGRALTSLGGQPGDHVGRTAQEVFGKAHVISEHMHRALAGEEFRAPVEIGPVALETWYRPSRQGDGSITGYTGVALNVTEQRRLERQILEISDREQARIGQEIHDGLCQQLVSLAFDANSLYGELQTRKMSQARTAKRMVDFLDESITEARQLARGLFPIRLEAQGLAPALEELARATRERHAIECRFVSEESVMVRSKTMATHLYRIAQEAITNALKHGRARSILIRLESTPGENKLIIEDDGLGILPAKLRDSRGMGLHIMDYRARAMAGAFSCSGRAAGGTVISCCVPKPID